MKTPSPSFGNILPAYDILIFSFPPFCPVQTIGEKIIIAVFTRALIDVRLSPRVNGNLLGKVGALPSLHARRFFSKGLQSFFHGRVSAHIEPKRIEGSAEHLNLRFRGTLPCPADLSEEPRPHQGSQQAEDGDDHKDLKA